MKLCPNCNKPFDEVAGKLYCETHGWHGVNEAGEIVPADEPTDSEMEAWEKSLDQKENAQAVDRPDGPADSGAVAVEIEVADAGPVINTTALLVFAAAVLTFGMCMACYYRVYKKTKAAAV